MSEVLDAVVAAMNSGATLAAALEGVRIDESPPTAPAAAGVAMDPKRRYCHGLIGTRGPFPPNYWLVPTGKTMAADTRCAHCQEVLGFRDGTHVPANTCASFNCDSASDPALTRVPYKGLEVGLTLLGHTDVPLYLDPENRHKTAEGVGIFVVPTQTEFQIVIDRSLGADAFAFDTFTVEEATVGDEKIVINDGRKVLYDSGRAVIRGFATGSDRSFLFVAPSEWEKASAPEARVAATLSESNIFTLKLQPWTRKAKETHREFDFGTLGGESFGGGTARLSSFGSFGDEWGGATLGFGCGAAPGASTGFGGAPPTTGVFGSFGTPQPTYGHPAPAAGALGYGTRGFGAPSSATPTFDFTTYAGGGIASTGFGGVAPATASSFGSFGAAPPGGAPPAPGASTGFGGFGAPAATSTFGVAIPLAQPQTSASASFPKPSVAPAAVGGATVSGGTHIDHVKTRTTTDTYKEYGEPIIIKLQLICRQSDSDRRRDNLRARLQQDGLDHWYNEAKQHLATKARLEKELADVQVRLANRIAAAKADWEGAVKAASAVVGRNAPLIAQLSERDLTGVQLDPRPTAQVKADKAAGDETRKSSMLLDV